MSRKLKYVGPAVGEPGFGYIPGVPASDHTCPSNELAAELVAGGLYEYATQSKKGEEKADEEEKAPPE